MNAFITALAPIIVLIAIGFGLRRIHFIPKSAWEGIEKLTYYILMPSLLIHTIGNQSITNTPWTGMLIAILGTLISVAIILIIFRKTISEKDTTFTSIFQGGLRLNNFIMLAMAHQLYGEIGLSMGSVIAGFVIVIVNLWSIAILFIWGNTSIKGIRPVIQALAFNPLVLGCAMGWGLNLGDVRLPILLDDILGFLGKGALPFGLLAVGAALKTESVKGHMKPVLSSSISQFGLKPILMAAFIHYLGLTGIPASVLTIAFMTPTAAAGYILAKQLGGDHESMASIITFQTILAFVIMPIWGALLL